MFARRWTREAAAHDQGVVAEFGGRLTSDPNRSSLGLLPSGPDPVGEWLVHRQPPAPYIGPTGRESKRAAGVIHAGLFAASDRLLPCGGARRVARPCGPCDVAPLPGQPKMSPRPDLGPKPALGYSAIAMDRAATRRS